MSDALRYTTQIAALEAELADVQQARALDPTAPRPRARERSIRRSLRWYQRRKQQPSTAVPYLSRTRVQPPA